MRLAIVLVDADYLLILRGREAASRRIEARKKEPGLHGSRGEAKHRPQGRLRASSP